MNKKEKGDILEVLVAVLETAGFSNNTNVYPNYKLTDSTGCKRDIDVYFETQVNNKTFKYGIECKHFSASNPVKMEHIDSLYGKISNTGVTGIIVTTGHVQKNALKKAKNYGIEVYQIIPNDTSISKQSNIILKRKSIAKIVSISDDLISDKQKKALSPEKLFYGKDKTELTLEEFTIRLEVYLKDEFSELYTSHYEDFYELDTVNKQININIKDRKSIVIDFPLSDFYLLFDDEYYEITKLMLKLDLWLELLDNEDLTGKKYVSLTEEITFSNFLTQSFTYMGKSLILNTIIDEKTGEVKSLISDKNKKGQIYLNASMDKLDSDWKIKYLK